MTLTTLLTVFTEKNIDFLNHGRLNSHKNAYNQRKQHKLQ